MTEFIKKFVSFMLILSMSLSLTLKSFAEEDVPKAQILAEITTGKILFEENSDVALPMASITKLMGLILTGEALEKGDIKIDEKISCSEYAKSMGGSEIWLKAGEEMTVEELLKAVMIVSANDAMMVLAEKIAATEDAFVQMMNEKAKDLGLENTNFKNAVGFDEENHYTCARDIVKMAVELQKYPDILKYATIWLDSLRNGETMLVNTNRLVRFYEGTTGLKTGTTEAAGHCLCATAEKNNLQLCAVVLGCKTSDGRFEACKDLLNYGYSNFTFYEPELPNLQNLEVSHGTKESLEIYAEVPQGIVIDRSLAKNISVEIPNFDKIPAPIFEGDELGELKIVSEGKEIAVFPICARENVEELTFSKCFLILLKGIFSENKI